MRGTRRARQHRQRGRRVHQLLSCTGFEYLITANEFFPARDGGAGDRRLVKGRRQQWWQAAGRRQQWQLQRRQLQWRQLQRAKGAGRQRAKGPSGWEGEHARRHRRPARDGGAWGQRGGQRPPATTGTGGEAAVGLDPAPWQKREKHKPKQHRPKQHRTKQHRPK